MASGLSLLVVSDKPNEISEMVKEFSCGICVKSNEVDKIVKVINHLRVNKETLEEHKKSSRETVMKLFSRKNTEMYAAVIRNHITSLL